MKNKKKFFILLFIFIIILLTIFLILYYKNNKNGNTTINKSEEEIINSILEMKSYSANLDITIETNKNKTQYKVKQSLENGKANQEVIEPQNIAGVITEYDGTNLKIENSQLSLNTILENYNYLGDNCLDLYSFIEDYKQDEKATFEEKDTVIIMKASSNI